MVASKKIQVFHMVFLFAVAFSLRVAIVQTQPIMTGMTWDYQTAALMLSADYGYKRTAGHYITKEMVPYSHKLGKQGKIISPQDRPNLDESTLRPIQHRLPGYPAFLYGVYQLFGEPLTIWAGMVQALLTAFYPFLIYALAMRLFDDAKYAWIAAWCSALYLPFAYLSVAAIPIPFVTGFVLIALYCCVRGLQEQRNRYLLLAGLAIGAGCYFKSSIVYLWVFLGLCMFLFQKGWKQPILSVAPVVLGIYVMLVPWAYWNQVNSGHWNWGSTITWVSIWKGVAENPNPWGVVLSDSFGQDFAKQNGFEDDVTPEANEWFKLLYLGYVKKDPVFFIHATIKRLPFTLAAPFSPGFTNPDRTKGIFSHFLKEGKTYIDVLFSEPVYLLKAYWERLIVMGISLAGSVSLLLLAVLNRERRREAFLLLVVPAYLICLHSVFASSARFLMPMIPCQLIAIVFLVKTIRDKWGQPKTQPQPIAEIVEQPAVADVGHSLTHRAMGKMSPHYAVQILIRK